MDTFLPLLLNSISRTLERFSSSFVTGLTSLSTKLNSTWVTEVSNLANRLDPDKANLLDDNVSSLMSSSSYSSSRVNNIDNLDIPITQMMEGDIWDSDKALLIDKRVSELSEGIKSIQTGSISLSEGESGGFSYISEVDTSKSELSRLGNSAGFIGFFAFGAEFVQLQLDNSTRISANRGRLDGETVVNWQLVEWH